jgi:hypothetical protein
MSTSTPIELELHRVFLTKGNAFRVEVRFDDDSYLTLDFESESDEHRQILDTLTRVATQALSRIGERGVTIAGLTRVDQQGEGE